ncbi:thiamine pyrophosphate-binding protein [Aquibacillus sp. 3ASR75-11]|uniref:Thiamine pyrophosphate-binding protein n=1 Tax=Terrihalobacillus insolitus TaxID=2950438 RepID=A0A9X3WP05_9BACI|nr:thiamine pyrophosphate-binding protein [Terrihalobacillus insolitus]MDC3423185.1 thiamine pyrophosphate-binding protein [Terrihalobacillus insolitus]
MQNDGLPTTNKTVMTGARAIIRCMRTEGVQKIFCVPGESYLPVLDAIYDESSIDLISARHESGAAFMAEGYAKSSGNPGVVMATRGVGAANLSIGVHTAYQDSTPMVVLLGQVHSKFRGREGFQEVDLDQYFKHIAKWAVEIKDAERVPETMHRAFRIAQSGRPGPVVIALPEDMLIKEEKMQFGTPFKKSRPRPSQHEIAEVEKRLRHAQRPVIIAGGGVKLAQAEDVLVQFAERYHLPVMAAFRRHDVFPNDHPAYIGHLGLGTHRNLIESIRQSDFILALGTRLSEVTTQDYSIISPDQTLIHIDIDSETLGKVYTPDVGIVSDSREALQDLLKMNIKSEWDNWVYERRQSYLESSSLPVGDGIINTDVMDVLQKTLPSNAIITNDAGNFAGWLHAYYQFKEKNTYIGPTSGAMGYGMPAAIGAKLANPTRTVLSLSGDGGFMMTLQELETAVRYQIPIISIVFNNQMYGTIRMHQELHYPNNVIGTDLGQVRFGDLAKSMQAVGNTVNSKGEFEYALLEAIKNNQPTVLEVNTDPNRISVTSTIEELRSRF